MWAVRSHWKAPETADAAITVVVQLAACVRHNALRKGPAARTPGLAGCPNGLCGTGTRRAYKCHDRAARGGRRRHWQACKADAWPPTRRGCGAQRLLRGLVAGVAGGLVQVGSGRRGRQRGAVTVPAARRAARPQRAPGPGEPRRAGSSESVCSLSPPRAHCAMITSVARRAIMVPQVRFELLAAPSQVEFKLLGNPTSLPRPSNPKAATRPSPDVQ